MSKPTGSDLQVSERLTDADLLNLGDGPNAFANAIALVEDRLGGVAEFGNGFTVTDKADLIGKDFIIIEWRFNAGSYGDDFVSVTAITTDGRKVIFNDGSTGVRDQLRAVTDATGRTAGVRVKNGLTVSEYEYPDPTTGEPRPAKTYYLSN